MTMFLVSSVSVLPSAGLHLDLAGRRDPAGALKGIDLVLLEQEGDALDVAVNAFVLELQHGGRSSLRRPTLMPMLAK